MGTSTLPRWVITCTLLMSTSFVFADDAIAADSEAGKIRSAICIGCHGLNGEGKDAMNGQPPFPRIAGQIQGYFIKSVNDYKSDSRNDPMMGAIAKGLSDIDIVNLAVYYSALK